MKTQKSFNNKELSTEQNFTIVYSGPTFINGIKVEKLITNLKAIQDLIYTIADVNLEYESGYNSRKSIKQILIVPRYGSIEEQIIIFFSKPEVRDAVKEFIIGLFFYLLTKKDSKEVDQKLDKITEKINEIISRGQSENIKSLYDPLENTQDTLSIRDGNKTDLEIGFNQKSIIDTAIKQREGELKTVETVEELEGKISAINIDTNHLKFHASGMEYAYPLYFDAPIEKLLVLIAIPIKAKLKVRRVTDKIKNFYLIDYKKLQGNLYETRQ